MVHAKCLGLRDDPEMGGSAVFGFYCNVLRTHFLLYYDRNPGDIPKFHVYFNAEGA